MNKYEAHVLEVAEEMARVNKPYAYSQYNKKGKVKSYYETWGYCIQDELLSARIAVRMEAEAFIECWKVIRGWDDKEELECNCELIDHGLIPAPETKKKFNFMCCVCDQTFPMSKVHTPVVRGHICQMCADKTGAE